MEKIELVGEQVIATTQRLQKLTEEEQKIIKLNRNEEKTNIRADFNNFSRTPDYTYMERLSAIRKEKIELLQILNNCIIKENIATDFVGIGTKFEATIQYDEDDIETAVYTLIEKSTTPKRDAGKFISVETPLGKAIFGKRAGETFDYQVTDLNIISYAKGVITKIIVPTMVEEQQNIEENGRSYTKITK